MFHSTPDLLLVIDADYCAYNCPAVLTLSQDRRCCCCPAVVLLLLYALPTVHVQIWILVECNVTGEVLRPGTRPGPFTKSASAVRTATLMFL